MGNDQRAILHTFQATDSDPIAAIASASEQLQAWYSEQEALWSVDGASLFKFGTHLLPTATGQYQYIITVLDTRRAEYQQRS